MLSIVDQLLPDDFFRSGGDVVRALSPANRISSFQCFCDTLCGLRLGDQGFHTFLDLLVQIGKVCPEVAGQNQVVKLDWMVFFCITAISG